MPGASQQPCPDARGGLTEICWPTIERARVKNGSPRS
jgi:hypothetical protein